MHLDYRSDMVKGNPVEEARVGSGIMVTNLATDAGQEIRVAKQYCFGITSGSGRKNETHSIARRWLASREDGIEFIGLEGRELL